MESSDEDENQILNHALFCFREEGGRSVVHEAAE